MPKVTVVGLTCKVPKEVTCDSTGNCHCRQHHCAIVSLEYNLYCQKLESLVHFSGDCVILLSFPRISLQVFRNKCA